MLGWSCFALEGFVKVNVKTWCARTATRATAESLPNLDQAPGSLCVLRGALRCLPAGPKEISVTKYQTVVDPAAANSSHSIIAKLVGSDKTVLDVGCATGYLARILIDQGCTVSGIEYDREAGEQAQPLLKELVIGDLNHLTLPEAFPESTFDVVVFGDVLEHLMDPASVLRQATDLLAPGGSIVVSLPNVAHGSVRLALLQGAWTYQETGLLDETHIRFFTLDGVEALLDSAGLVATEMAAVVLDPLGVEVKVDQSRLPDGVVDWVRRQPQASTYQFVLRAVPESTPGARPVHTPTPAVDLEVPVDGHIPGEVLVRLADKINARNAAAAEDAKTARHQLLTARDNAIGLENTALLARAELAGTRADVVETHKRLRAALDENIRMDGEVRARDEEILRMRRSKTWRVGFLLLHPIAFLRGVRW